MRGVALVAIVGTIAVAFSGAAAARDGHGFQGGGSHWGGFHHGGAHALRGGMSVAHSHSFGGNHAAASGNLRSNRGGLRRGHERAAYVHRLNHQRHEAHQGHQRPK